MADMIAVIHLGYVAFVVAGFILIVCGVIFSWQWIRNPWFRLSHLMAIVGVALEALLGIECPLTVLEFKLRSSGYHLDRHASFLGSLADSLLYYRAPEWVFTAAYTVCAVLGVIVFIVVPPTRRGKARYDGA